MTQPQAKVETFTVGRLRGVEVQRRETDGSLSCFQLVISATMTWEELREAAGDELRRLARQAEAGA